MSRTDFDICLVVETASAALGELEKSIGPGEAEWSHDKGTPHMLKSRGVWPTTVWQQCSGCPRNIAVEEQFAALDLKLSSSRLLSSGALPADAHVYFSIGVFSDAQSPAAKLTPRILAIAAKYRAHIELKFYASNMDS